MTISTQLAIIFEDLFGLDKITPETSMDTVAEWDSVMHVTLILTLEQEFGVQINPEDAVLLSSVAGISGFLISRSATRRAA